MYISIVVKSDGMRASVNLDLVVDGAQGRTPTSYLNFAPRTNEVYCSQDYYLLDTYLLLDDILLLANVYHGRQYWPDYSWFKNSSMHQIVLEFFIEFQRDNQCTLCQQRFC